MNKQFITGTMLQGSFFSVNKVVAKYLKSNDAALLLSHLIYLQEHHFKGGEFYQQQEKLMEECNLSKSALRICMKILSDAGIVSIKKKGTPAKNYYTINFSVLEDIFSLSSDQDSDHKRSTTIRDQETVSQVITFSSTSDQDSDHRRSISCSQIIDNNKIDKNKVNKNKIDNTVINKKEILIKNKLYHSSSKIPSSFNSEESYINFLYNREYERVLQ